ncbi:hypothetical protein SAMN05444171_0927 [Bradyrhizobium lablabi]|uniref:Uncharacterized protein n=2 Tax=Bradyrhizobium TaxID=374 RepID=A0ABY0Q8V0_9BRAD|nr:hypothetical protein SAMN05444163_6233 [Bradyrhizobium ottawaense]SEC22465.1 hypothetical protein SAMN05444171_0927 [Bradyrhizobium lablabi]
MNSHKNAPQTPKGREAMVRSVIEGDLTKAAAAICIFSLRILIVSNQLPSVRMFDQGALT